MVFDGICAADVHCATRCAGLSVDETEYDGRGGFTIRGTMEGSSFVVELSEYAHLYLTYTPSNGGPNQLYHLGWAGYARTVKALRKRLRSLAGVEDA